MAGVHSSDIDQNEVRDVADILDDVLNRVPLYDDIWIGAEGIVEQATVTRHYSQKLTRHLLWIQLTEIRPIDGSNMDEKLQEEMLDRLCDYYKIERDSAR